jgi:hypothetical protein
MFDNNDLADALVKTARVLDDTDQVNVSADLQQMLGDADDTRVSTFAQFKPNPNTSQIPNPMSPIEGDDIFWAYMISGAAYQANDGSQWTILDYDWEGKVEVENRWYPRIHAVVSVADVRRSIDSWIEPIQQKVPPPPAGVDYAALPVRIVETVERAPETPGNTSGSW